MRCRATRPPSSSSTSPRSPISPMDSGTDSAPRPPASAGIPASSAWRCTPAAQPMPGRLRTWKTGRTPRPPRARLTRRICSTPESPRKGCRRPEDDGIHRRGSRGGHGVIVENWGALQPPASTAKDPHMTLFDGITARIVETPRLAVNILERTGDDPATPPDRTLVLVHGNVSSSLFWQELMEDLPSDLRVIAIDLRGFGGTEHAPIDATRGVRDFSDDVFATLQQLGIPTAHFVGWSMGAGVIMQYALDHPTLSLTLESPVSPYGFGGTRRDGTRVTDDDAGTGGGVANPEYVQRLIDHDETDEAQTSPRSVFRSGYVAPGYETTLEDLWV